jgi:hypothetical protein
MIRNKPGVPGEWEPREALMYVSEAKFLREAVHNLIRSMKNNG